MARTPVEILDEQKEILEQLLEVQQAMRRSLRSIECGMVLVALAAAAVLCSIVGTIMLSSSGSGY